MRRRRVRVAKAPYGVGQKRVKTPSSEADSLAPPGFKSRQPFLHARINCTVVTRTVRTTIIGDNERPIRRGRDIRVKRQVQRAAQVSAALGVAVSLMGFFLIRPEEGQMTQWDYVQFALVALLTIPQLPLVVLFWVKSLRFLEMSRRQMRLDKAKIPRLLRSPRALGRCVCECVLNAVCLVPAQNVCTSVEIFGVQSAFCYEQVMYLLILLRNYHFLRLIYWSSDFAGMRARLYARLINVRYGYGFITRCFLARYSFKFIILLYLAVVVLSGVCHHETDFINSRENSLDAWDDFWLVAYTQATIGYGVNLSKTFFSQVVIILACFAGSFMIGLLSTASHDGLTLSLAEANLCAELVLGNIRRKQMLPAVDVLQAWWRLMLMRKAKELVAPVIIGFYFSLGKFRSLLVARNRIKHGRFEYQIESFDVSVRRKLSALAEYISPIKASDALVPTTQTHDIVRTEYQLYHSFKELRRARKSQRMLKPPSFDGSQCSEESRLDGSSTPRNLEKTKNSAKAKLDAHRHLKVRLLEVP